MQNAKVYLVGGAVRDHLLGIESRDLDYVVVGSSPEALIAEGFTQVGASFPVFLHPVTGNEYALARTERKTGPGYHGFDTVYDSSVTLEDDLMRRDLTINAMAMTANLQIIDPFNGVKDLADGVLRHTSEAFADDPLRILRLARFAARYNFKVAPETMDLAKKLVASGELEALPRERIWTELYKGFSEKYSEKMLQVLHDVGALKVAPLVDYFGLDFNPSDYFHSTAGTGITWGYPVNLTDVNAMIALWNIVNLDDKVILEMKVPNRIRDALRLERLLSKVLVDPELNAEKVHSLFNTTRFVTNYESETMQLALFVSCMCNQKFVRWNATWGQNMLQLIVSADAVTSLDMRAIVESGDMKTVKVRVDQEKLTAISKSFA